MAELTIGEVARQSGLNPHTLRYYEKVGLLSAPARRSGRRVYDSGVLTHLEFLKRAREAGFGIGQLRRLVETLDGNRFTPASQEAGARRLLELDAAIAELRRARAKLVESLACPCSSLTSCTMLHTEER